MIRNRNLVVDVSPPSLVDRSIAFISLSGRVPSNRLKTRPGRIIHEPGTRVRERRSNLEMEVSKYNKYLEGKRIPVSVRSELWLVHTVSSRLSRESFIIPPVSISLTYRVFDFNYIQFRYPNLVKSLFLARPRRILDKFIRILTYSS